MDIYFTILTYIINIVLNEIYKAGAEQKNNKS